MSNHTHFIPCTSPWMVCLITIEVLKRNHTLRHCITHRACPHYSRTQDRQNTGFHRGKGDCSFCSGSDAPLLSCSSAHLESLKWAAEHCAQSYRWIIHEWLFALLIYSPHAYSIMVSTHRISRNVPMGNSTDEKLSRWALCCAQMLLMPCPMSKNMSKNLRYLIGTHLMWLAPTFQHILNFKSNFI